MADMEDDVDPSEYEEADQAEETEEDYDPHWDRGDVERDRMVERFDEAQHEVATAIVGVVSQYRETFRLFSEMMDDPLSYRVQDIVKATLVKEFETARETMVQNGIRMSGRPEGVVREFCYGDKRVLEFVIRLANELGHAVRPEDARIK